MRVLAIGDIVGKPGRRAWAQLGRSLARVHRADFTIVNCENAAGGFGITPEIAEELLGAGADCLTSGNHIWKHRTIYGYIEEEARLLRPANFPDGTPGRGLSVYSSPAGELAVMNIMGLYGLEDLDCPFRTFDALYEEARQATSNIIVDFHAESTGEKAAFAHYVDGRASLVFGTHTHVQTADERILPGGTGFITDLGMTGPEDTVIGVAKEIMIERFLTRMPQRFDVPDNAALLCGIVAEFDARSSKTAQIARIQERVA